MTPADDDESGLSNQPVGGLAEAPARSAFPTPHSAPVKVLRLDEETVERALAAWFESVPVGASYARVSEAIKEPNRPRMLASLTAATTELPAPQLQPAGHPSSAVTCPDCYGAGHDLCESCDGSGARGHGKCRDCIPPGSGRLECPSCEGTGLVSPETADALQPGRASTIVDLLLDECGVTVDHPELGWGHFFTASQLSQFVGALLATAPGSSPGTDVDDEALSTLLDEARRWPMPDPRDPAKPAPPPGNLIGQLADALALQLHRKEPAADS